jgi:hypothetical protein
MSLRRKYRSGDSAKGKVYKALVTGLLARCGRRCENPWCRVKAALDPHHVVKRSQGGEDTADNLVMVCRYCHGATDLPHDSDKWLGVKACGRQEFLFSTHKTTPSPAFEVQVGRTTTYLRYRRTK